MENIIIFMFILVFGIGGISRSGATFSDSHIQIQNYFWTREFKFKKKGFIASREGGDAPLFVQFTRDTNDRSKCEENGKINKTACRDGAEIEISIHKDEITSKAYSLETIYDSSGPGGGMAPHKLDESCEDSPATGEDMCRLSGRCLPKKLFALHTCASCYRFMPKKLFHRKLETKRKTYSEEGSEFHIEVLSNGSHSFEADILYPPAAIVDSFSKGIEKWRDCCAASIKCCFDMTSSPLNQDAEMCPRTWDGWQCWNATERGLTISRPCPNFIYFFSVPPACPPEATKECLSSGKWFLNEQGAERSNYASCSTVGYLQNRFRVQLAAHTISVAALLPALIIFFCYKQLRVPRISMHKNLFASLLLNSCIVLIFKGIVLLGEDEYELIKKNSSLCIFLLLLTKMSRLSNYMWMFCEAFYLHKLVASSFAEQRGLKGYYLIGWVFPVVPISIYAWLRIHRGDELCWVVPAEPFEWVLNTPCLLALLINVLFMINIIRVLVTKLRAAHSREPYQYRKAVRATLVLVPLFGLHFLVTIYRPESVACNWTELYHYFNSCIDGLQGFSVAVVFCYMNGEVRNLLYRSYMQWRDHRRHAFKWNHRQSQSRQSQSACHQHHTTVSSFENIKIFEEDHPDSERGSNKVLNMYDRLRRASGKVLMGPKKEKKVPEIAEINVNGHAFTSTSSEVTQDEENFVRRLNVGS